MTFPLPGANWGSLHGPRPLATTGLDGFALQNGTPNILTWDAPDDGKLHEVSVHGSVCVTSAETGGALTLYFTNPAGLTTSFVVTGGGTATNGVALVDNSAVMVLPGTTVTLSQTTALTAGEATVYATLWGM